MFLFIIIMNKTPNEKLKLFFKGKGLNNTQIAERLGFTPSMTSLYLGKRKLKLEFILAVVREFPDVDLNYVFKDSTEESENVDIILDIEEKLKKLKENLTRA
jgi:predicted transcriptional regulator